MLAHEAQERERAAVAAVGTPRDDAAGVGGVGDRRHERPDRLRSRPRRCCDHADPMADRHRTARRAPARGRQARAGARRSRSSRTTTPRAGSWSATVYPHTGNATVVGFTGPPGRRQVDADRLADHGSSASATATIAVLSIDPVSPFTEGALLGDRIRLTEHFLDPGVFIRSMANRGALGGLSEAALQARAADGRGRHGRRLRRDGRRRPGRGRRRSTTPTRWCSC